MMRLQRFFRFVVIPSAASMLTVATFSARADETIKIGPIAAFSGPLGDYC